VANITLYDSVVFNIEESHRLDENESRKATASNRQQNWMEIYHS